MTPHILIFTDNLCGLITAYRLIHYGFRITILDLQRGIDSDPAIPREPGFLLTNLPGSYSNPGDAQVPLILFGCYRFTKSLFQEISFEQAFLPSQQVALEFGLSHGRNVLSYAPWPASLPPLLRLPFFRELSWSDRWQMINFLEKKWESAVNGEAGSDTVSVDSWLGSAKQSPQAVTTVWNPLCRFLLGCDTTEASLEYFLNMLSGICLPAYKQSKIFLVSPDILNGLHHRLREILKQKQVTFQTIHRQPQVQIDRQGIRAIASKEGKLMTADAYVSTISPADLLSLLPERALARFSSFSHLFQLRECSGTAFQMSLPGSSPSARLILNTGLCDWVASYTVSDGQASTTCITGIRLSSSPSESGNLMTDSAWNQIRQAFNLSPGFETAVHASPVKHTPYTYYPCPSGMRMYRPISSTPIPNLYLAGPWTATSLPPGLESTVMSAYACASILAERTYTASH